MHAHVHAYTQLFTVNRYQHNMYTLELINKKQMNKFTFPFLENIDNPLFNIIPDGVIIFDPNTSPNELEIK